MASFTTTQQSFNEMDDKKQVICAWNRNHKVNHSRYQKHQLSCPDRPKVVHKCQYNFLHEFKTAKEKDNHELTCEGMIRRLREQKELAEFKKRKTVGAPVVVEKAPVGQSSDPWADEGIAEGVKDFKASGLGLTPQEIEDFVEKYDGNEPVCEYMLVAMSWSQKKRITDKQKIRTLERAAVARKNDRDQIAQAVPIRAPRNAVVASLNQQADSSQETAEGEIGDEEPQVQLLARSGQQASRDRNNPWGTNLSQPSNTPQHAGDNVAIKLSGIGRGRGRAPPSSYD